MIPSLRVTQGVQSVAQELSLTMDAKSATPPTSSPPGAPVTALRVGKDVSVGEYDRATGLTFVTRQRGRLHFHMGVNAVRLAGRTGDRDNHSQATAGADTTNAMTFDTAEQLEDADCARGLPQLRTGVFTGLALFAEEAYYLVQRRALVVYELQSDVAWPLDVAQFAALLLSDKRASLPCLDVYVSLKEHKFHPRRAVTDSETALTHPEHYSGAECPFAFDVWQASTETVYVPNEDYAAPIASEKPHGGVVASTGREGSEESAKRRAKKDKKSVTKRKLKRLRLAFRVVVCRYSDPPPSARMLLASMRSAASMDSDAWIPPVKLAVVDEDHSVLFFEVGAPEAVVK